MHNYGQQTQPRAIMNHKILATMASIFVFATFSANADPIEDGLQVWLRASTGISVGDGASVVTWLDESGNGRNAVYNPLNAFGELAPVYDQVNAGLNGQATVRFNNNSALELDLNFLTGSDYTIFAVNGRDRFGLANFYLAGDSLSPNSNLTLGYEQPALLRQAHFANDLDAAVENYIGQEIFSLDAFLFDQVSGRELFHNGQSVATDTNTLPLLSNTGTTLGHFRAFGSAFWFQGDLAEVAIYDRRLTEDELLIAGNDLAERYGFPVTPVSVPEPGTLTLFGIGLLGLGLARRKAP